MHFSKLFVNIGIITFLRFPILNLLQDPFLKFEMIGISSSIDSKRVKSLALPEFFKSFSLNLSHFGSNMVLVFIVISFNVFLPFGSHSIIVENELTHFHVIKMILSGRIFPISHWNTWSPKSMNQPFWLKLNFGNYWLWMFSKRFLPHMIRIIFPKSAVVSNIQIKSWSIIDSTFSSRNCDDFRSFLHCFFGFGYFLQIWLVLFIVDVVWNLVRGVTEIVHIYILHWKLSPHEGCWKGFDVS